MLVYPRHLSFHTRTFEWLVRLCKDHSFRLTSLWAFPSALRLLAVRVFRCHSETKDRI